MAALIRNELQVSLTVGPSSKNSPTHNCKKRKQGEGEAERPGEAEQQP